MTDPAHLTALRHIALTKAVRRATQLPFADGGLTLTTELLQPRGETYGPFTPEAPTDTRHDGEPDGRLLVKVLDHKRRVIDVFYASRTDLQVRACDPSPPAWWAR